MTHEERGRAERPSSSVAGSFWDREIVEQQHISWLEHPLVRGYVNAMVGGWPFDWFQQWAAGRRFERALSIGCGGGALERDLILRNLCGRVDAFDGSVNSLRLAHEAARAAGMSDRIRYFAADFNEPALPAATYDLVLFHQSAHHVAKLEKLYRAIRRSMKPGAILYLDEYVGPSRTDWTDRMIAPHRRVYASLPAAVREIEHLPFPVQSDDPSEAIRSSEIEPQLRVGFRTLARRPYGGTLLSVVFPLLRRDQLSEGLVQQLIEEERRLLEAGAPSYYSILIAEPRSGAAAAYADLHYFIVPKARRLLGLPLIKRSLRRVQRLVTKRVTAS